VIIVIKGVSKRSKGLTLQKTPKDLYISYYILMRISNTKIKKVVYERYIKMRTENIKKKIFKFEELNNEQQEEILNNYRDINVDFDDWNDYILYDFIEAVKEKTGLEIEFKNITWAVGDRNAHFGVYSKDILNQLLNRFEEKGVYDIDTPTKLGSFLIHNGGGICTQGHTQHSRAEVYFEDDETDEQKNKAVEKQINDIINDIISLSVEYHNKNEEAYNYALSDESVKDTIKANEYEFDEDTLKIY
jgi:hypothetical protein